MTAQCRSSCTRLRTAFTKPKDTFVPDGWRAPPEPGHTMSSSTKRWASCCEEPFAEPGVQHVAGVSAGGQDEGVAEHPCVATGGALLDLAVHLTDRGVQIDRNRCVVRIGTPGDLARRFVSAITAWSWRTCPESERAQERAQRRGFHHSERQHLLRIWFGADQRDRCACDRTPLMSIYFRGGQATCHRRGSQ
jgi:hypothetical protein